MCRERIAGIELSRPPRGTRDSVIVVVVVVLYLALKLIGSYSSFALGQFFSFGTQLSRHKDILAVDLAPYSYF